MHNGTLSTASKKALEAIVGEEFDSDSQAIFAALEKHSVKEVVGNLQGAWALVWWDKDAEALRVLKNDQRPLWYAYSEDRSVMMFASEYEIIRAATSIGANEKLWANEEGYTYFPFENDTLYEFSFADVYSLSKFLHGKPKCTPNMKGKPAAPKNVNFTMGQSHKTPALTNNHGNKNTGKNSTGTSDKEQKKLNDRRWARSTEVGGTDAEPFGGLFPSYQIDYTFSNGCQWCDTPIQYGDIGVYVDKVNGYALCKNCHNHPSDTNTIMTLEINNG